MSKLTEQEVLLIELLFENAHMPVNRPYLNELAVKAGFKSIAQAIATSKNIEEALRKRSALELTLLAPKATQVTTEVLNGNPLVGKDNLKAATEVFDRIGLGKIDRVQAEVHVNGIVELPPLTMATRRTDDADQADS